jgi:Protein of unknown function (DUF1553)/Protein of unknown function (DUF1549)/Planctomycete cytochrome C
MPTRFMASLLAVALLTTSVGADAGAEFFEKKIRPIFVAQCNSCHSVKAKKLRGKFLLDSRADLMRGGEGGAAIVPGDPDKSRLIHAVRYADVDFQMPPREKLSVRDIADLVAWVKMGAPWPGAAGPAVVKEEFDLARRKATHWAWRPLAVPVVPAVKDSTWARSNVDRFLLSRLEAKSLRPAPATDRGTLLRRLSFDLVGLPPTPDEIEAFRADARPDAVERQVDRLMASPRFGERWGRHWLDLVRYAETRGHEFDPIIPNAYQYRDYILRALNDDVPYDRLVTEHIAGDLVASPRLHPAQRFNESILGTGFWFLGEEVHSPVDIRADQADRFDNRIDVMAKTFLGLTVSCARCHDHKFDAISAKDYYALYGYLSSSNYRQVRFDSLEQNKTVARDLWKVRREKSSVVAKLFGSALNADTRGYLLAAREAIASRPADVVFEDFESGTYDKWEVTGTAFGKSPQTAATIGAYQGKVNAVGKYFVNSHNIRQGEDIAAGDAHTGRMKSKAFTIDHDAITMLVGGGAHKDKTCVNLVVGGKVVRSATGRNDNRMFPVRWDVRSLRGKQAAIEIVDDHTGGWGNTGVDQIVFTNKPATDPDSLQIARIARAHDLDAKRLGLWVSAVLAAKANPADPLHAFAKSGSVRAPANKPAASNIVVDFRSAAWLPDDVTFGSGPTLAGGLRITGTPEKPVVRVAERTAGEFDSFWSGLKIARESETDHGSLGARLRSGRTLRTPTFALTSGKLHMLVRGSGMVYASVGSHTLIAGPLHGRLVQSFGPSASYRWVSHDLSVYAGQNVHLEFTADDKADFAVALVSQGAPGPIEEPITALDRLVAGASSPTALAAGYDRLFRQTADQLRRGELAEGGQARLANWMVRHSTLFTSDTSWTRPAAELLREESNLSSRIRRESRLAPAMQDGSGVDEYVFIRGSHRAVGPTVPRRFLAALSESEDAAPKGSGRLELARKMLDTGRNPLLARVAVNRVWHHLFGRGIVGSVDNFGVMGQAPTHPELLDHLATRFVADGWSMKRLVRSLVLTKAYQMSSRPDAIADKVDPENLLLHHFRTRRLEGEAIRDALLAISGTLDGRMFGPSVNVHLTDFQQGRGRPSSGPLDGDGRRSVYLATKRNFLSSLLLAFDTPTPFSTVGKRTVSNVPAQSLILMNDPFVHQQARLWADRMAREPGDDAARIRRMYLAAFGRPPRAAEVTACCDYLREGTWADLAHALVNVKEFIYVP